MEEQEIQQKKKSAKDTLLGYVIVLFGTALALTVIGTVLGAINFVSPVKYPALVLVLWVLSCLYVMVFIGTHIGISIFLIVKHKPAAVRTEMTGEDAAVIGLVTLAIIIAIAGSIMIGTKHFGMFSGLAFIVVFTMMCIDFALWVKTKNRHE